MTRTDDFAEARRAAQEVWIGCGRPGPGELDLHRLARRLGLVVVRGELHGAVARLNYLDGRGVIRLADDGFDETHERFSVAHEIAHAVLHRASASCVADELQGLCDLHDREAEANAFAAELLMPQVAFERLLAGRALTLEVVREAAERFDVSRTATAIRLVDTTDEAMALVMCRDGTVRWCKKNVWFWPWIGESIPKGSLTATALREGRQPTEGRFCEFEAWCRRPRSGRAPALFEEVMLIPRHAAALTLLTIDGD